MKINNDAHGMVVAFVDKTIRRKKREKKNNQTAADKTQDFTRLKDKNGKNS